MNSLTWLVVTLGSMFGAFVVATIGVVLIALLLANVSCRLTRYDDYRDY
jgi:hypothetical protein